MRYNALHDAAAGAAPDLSKKGFLGQFRINLCQGEPVL